MKILNHRLHDDAGNPIRFEATNNRGGPLTATEYLVMHYTAGSSLESVVRYFKRAGGAASAHVVIGRDGEVVQMVPFNRVAWHAGESRWNDRVGLNRYAIGIELDNAGMLQRVGSAWRAWFGRDYPDAEVLVARHKNQSEDAAPSGWQDFPEAQIASALEVATAIVQKYGILDVVGHDDIAPHRKIDPGPAFPMLSFRARVMGRRQDDEVLLTTDDAGEGLNVRGGPGTEFGLVDGSPLPRGTHVSVRERYEDWVRVRVIGAANGVADIDGWVHGYYLHAE